MLLNNKVNEYAREDKCNMGLEENKSLSHNEKKKKYIKLI